MLRFPLRVPILLITSGGKFIGKITNAGDDCLKVIDVVEKIITPNGEMIYTDNDISGVFHFDRKQIIAYKTLLDDSIHNETDTIIDQYNNILTETKRQQFKIIKFQKTNGEKNDKCSKQ